MSSAEATTKACSVCLDESGGKASTSNGSNAGSNGGSVSPDTMMLGSADVAAQIDGLVHEVTQLKNDKLQLLQENVVSVCVDWWLEICCHTNSVLIPQHSRLPPQKCQSEIKLRREHEQSLQCDLAAAGKEIVRLRELLKEFVPAGVGQQHSMSPM